MRAIVVMLIVVPAMLPLGCGGRVDGGPGAPKGPPYVDSGPAPGPCPPPSNALFTGACETLPELSCATEVPVEDCNGVIISYVACSCAGGAWACDDSLSPYCPDAEPIDAAPAPDFDAEPSSPCPPPSEVHAGMGCDTHLLQCPGDPTPCGGDIYYDALQCQYDPAGVERWVVVAATICDVDASFLDAPLLRRGCARLTR